MEEQTGPRLAEILMALRRRALLIAAIFVVGSAAAVSVASSLPPVYSSTAKILVESQQIPTDLARSTVTASASERLHVIEQRLMTRRNLLAIAADLDLFSDRPGMTPTDKVAALRGATQIGRSSQVQVFTITYRSSDPAEAALVANELVTRILEQNLRQRSARASDTNDFFKAEIDRLSQEIADVERQLTQFKIENQDRLPDGQELRQSQLMSLQGRRFEREKRRTQLEEQKRVLTEALANGLPVSERNLTPEERELNELRRTLTMRRAVLAESHPQIRAIVRRIEVLEGLLQPASATDDEDAAADTAERRVERRLELVEKELDLLARQDEEDQMREVALKEAIEASPSVGLALAGLQRRYSDLQSQRQTTVRKQVEAEMGERLEVNQKAERFEIIEQAQVPTAPDAPDRKMIAAGGVGGSLALGLGLAVLAEMMNPAIRTPFQLERRTGLRPIVTVPWISTTADRRRRRRRLMAAAVALVVGLPLLLFVVDRQVMALPVLAEKLVDKSGLAPLVGSLGRLFGG